MTRDKSPSHHNWWVKRTVSDGKYTAKLNHFKPESRRNPGAAASFTEHLEGGTQASGKESIVWTEVQNPGTTSSVEDGRSCQRKRSNHRGSGDTNERRRLTWGTQGMQKKKESSH